MLTTRLGWFGMVAYALPILEVWLLTRMSERGSTVFLVVLQALWVVALLFVLDRCLRGSRAYRAAAAEHAAAAAEEAEREALAVANAGADAHARAGVRPHAGVDDRLGRSPSGRARTGSHASEPRAPQRRTSADRRRSHR